MGLMSKTVAQAVIPTAVGILFALLQWFMVSKVSVSGGSREKENLMGDEEDDVDDAVVVLKCAEIQNAISVGVIWKGDELIEGVAKALQALRSMGNSRFSGIYPEIAVSKHEHWSSLAPLPFEVVVSAGQKAKEDSWSQGNNDSEIKNKLVRDLSDTTGEGNIESTLSVERPLEAQNKTKELESQG